MNITASITIAATVVLLINALINNIGENQNTENSNNSPFECGFQAPSYNRLPFSSQFFIVIILFLVFDVEISIILPYPNEENTQTSNNTILLFIMTLIAGLLYEWNNGNLEWSE